MKSALILIVLIFVASLGCESSSDADRGSDTDTDTDTDSDTDADTDSDSDTGDAICDETDFSIKLAPVRLMILQDMSFSMADTSVADPTNWSHTVPALNTMLTNWTATQIEFGWDIFPDSAYEAARKAGVLDERDLEPIKEFMDGVKPWPAKSVGEKKASAYTMCCLTRSAATAHRAPSKPASIPRNSQSDPSPTVFSNQTT